MIPMLGTKGPRIHRSYAEYAKKVNWIKYDPQRLILSEESDMQALEAFIADHRIVRMNGRCSIARGLDEGFFNHVRFFQDIEGKMIITSQPPRRSRIPPSAVRWGEKHGYGLEVCDGYAWYGPAFTLLKFTSILANHRPLEKVSPPVGKED